LYFFEREGRASLLGAPPPGKAVIADITATLTAQTPWGPFTHTETGKYWRSRDGKVRQDTEHGLSTVADLGSVNLRSNAYIDYDLRLILAAQERPDLRFPRIRSRPTADTTGNDFPLVLQGATKPKKSGNDILDGFKVTIRKGNVEMGKGQPTGQTYEIWTSEELKIILLFKLKSGTAEFVQRYHNIRLEEPDPSVFELPPGFRIVTSSSDRNRPRQICWRVEVGISGEPRPREVTYPCSP
jgi:hypothetical protein